MSEIKLKLTWGLGELKTITKSIDNCQFEVVSRSDGLKALYQCETIQDRNNFLDTLWKLSDQYVKSIDRPKFINYQFKGNELQDTLCRNK